MADQPSFRKLFHNSYLNTLDPVKKEYILQTLEKHEIIEMQNFMKEFKKKIKDATEKYNILESENKKKVDELKRENNKKKMNELKRDNKTSEDKFIDKFTEDIEKSIYTFMKKELDVYKYLDPENKDEMKKALKRAKEELKATGRFPDYYDDVTNNVLPLYILTNDIPPTPSLQDGGKRKRGINKSKTKTTKAKTTKTKATKAKTTKAKTTKTKATKTKTSKK